MNPQIRRLALDLGPLLIFFAAFKYLGIFGATAAFIAAVLLALAIGYLLEKKLSPMPMFTAVLVGVSPPQAVSNMLVPIRTLARLIHRLEAMRFLL